MRFSDIKGQDAFKTVGKIIRCIQEFFKDEKLRTISIEKKKGWILDFFAESLENKADVWEKMFILLNPDVKEYTLGSVIKFAYDFKNDPELMSLFFSEGEQMQKESSGSPTVKSSRKTASRGIRNICL